MAILGLDKSSDMQSASTISVGSPILSNLPWRKLAPGLRRAARKYAALVTYCLVASIVMVGWTYFLGLAMFRGIIWALG
jgi:hypothetical protein